MGLSILREVLLKVRGALLKSGGVHDEVTPSYLKALYHTVVHVWAALRPLIGSVLARFGVLVLFYCCPGVLWSVALV